MSSQDDEIVELMAEALRGMSLGDALTSDERARVALDALRAAGYVVVPVEPTLAMQDAGIDAIEERLSLDADNSGPRILFPYRTAADAYRAMLAAHADTAPDDDERLPCSTHDTFHPSCGRCQGVTEPRKNRSK